MIICTWSDKFATGIPAIDAQHKHLFELVNNLANAMLSGKGTTMLGQLFTELLDYTKEHFSAEEKLFYATTYPDTIEHKKAHQGLIDELNTLFKRFQAGEYGLSVHTLDFLKKWIEDHIMLQDMGYKTYIKS